ncbi:uncharacterized protein KGF55_004620 [Candida pseudojiufengensis]|uniref:uncharacterized protein n=1 Tax=Candida pseudojiufengensis TaxID=497109 RepID=UPI002224B223|nr:uncharacterized protein KGF55_004620 [Candida pseudojiufengensis]KAI5960328.1 hypothetical protein KGF55_004620 [Candida pseudojiufengensis]
MSTTTQTLKFAKRKLRNEIKSKLKIISQDSLNSQSQSILNKLQDSTIFKNAKTIAVYMNMPDSEIKTLPIINECFKLNKQVYLPNCNTQPAPNRKKIYLSMLKVPSFQHVLDLKPQGKYQLLEPLEGEDAIEQGDLDLILIPGVAFTSNLKRLGHGAGFYDEFLSAYHNKWSTIPTLIGLALEEQIVEDDVLPVENHDYELNQLITNSDTYPKPR